MFFESFLLNLLVLIVLIIALIFDYATKFFSYWYVRHVPYKRPVPFFGSDYHRVLGIRNTTEEVMKLYTQYSNEKFVGTIKSRIPDLLVKDLDGIEKMFSTNFANFHSRGLDLNKSADICIRNDLFYADGENWTLLRKTLDSLMKNMTWEFDDCIHDCLSGTNGDTNLQQLLSNVLDVVFKYLLLGCNVKASESSVITNIRSALQKRTLIEKLKGYLRNIFPSLYVLFGLITLPGQPANKTLETIEKSKLMEEFKKIKSIFELKIKDKCSTKRKRDSDVEIAFSIFSSFISEGYIPCHYILMVLLYELAQNQQVQQKLRKSIKNSTEKEYLDKVINEALRLHPPYSVITRKCVKTYKFSESSLLIDKGVTITIPIEAIHKDSGYYKEAEAFNPDRNYDDENSSGRAFCYLPFGAGPRKCIGEQLSRQIMRSVIRTILLRFKIEQTDKTPPKLPKADHNFGRVIDKDIWLKFTPVNFHTD